MEVPSNTNVVNNVSNELQVGCVVPHPAVVNAEH